MGNRYKLARVLANPQRRKEILEIIKQEEQKDSWTRIKWATSNPRTGDTQKVQKFVDSVKVDVLEASEMNKEIQEVTEKRFDLAHSAAITRSSLQHLVRYCATTTFAMDLLNGRETMPADVDDDTATLICEFQRIFKHLRHKHTPVDITPDNYCFYWGWVSKSTSLAMSSVHFRHWKALAKDRMLVNFICMQLNLIA